MKSVSMARPAADAIIAADRRGVLIAYLSYVLADVRVVDDKAYQLLQLTIEALRSEDAPLTH